MTISSEGPADLEARIDAIEEAYEYCLAYAAQGRRGDEEGPRPEIRRYLERLTMALGGLAETARAELGGSAGLDDLLSVLEEDSRRAAAIVGAVLAQPRISSQLVDNLNASIHLRALLTDLFVLDELRKLAGAGERNV